MKLEEQERTLGAFFFQIRATDAEKARQAAEYNSDMEFP